MNSLIEHYRAMAHNNAWCNNRLHKACSRLPDDQFVERRTNFFPSLQLTLNHILLIDCYYVAGLEGACPDYSTFDNKVPYPTMRELSPAQRELDLRLIAFCDALEPTDLQRPVRFKRNPTDTYEETVASVLPHLFLHQIHHRGQVTAMLAGTPEKPPQLDEFFLLSDRVHRDRE